MSGQCLICRRQARGFRHADLRFKAGEERAYPKDWVFCSRTCQEAFHARYVAWLKTRPSLKEALVIESPEQEHEARLAALRHWIGAVDSIGFEKPLSRYSKEEALRVVEAILTGWTQAMAGVSPCGQSSNKESR